MGRERLNDDLICLALSALLLGSDYLILTEDTDYYKSRVTFMVRKKKREGGNRKKGKRGCRVGKWITLTWVVAGWLE